MSDLESYVVTGIQWLKLAAEVLSVLIIASGILFSLYNLVRPLRWPDIRTYNLVRLGFSRYLVLALEFQLAADLLGTSISPTWDQLGKLAVVAAIRTFLNFFLQYELKQERSEETDKPASAGGSGGL
ncbi:MAG TPA: DUF1622 domain-containing protein [Methanocella sp.]|nr:DUF1622 domain-containing protein [Methanocella sp.]